MTTEEFISLLEVDKEKIHEVLRPQIHLKILESLVGGLFDNSQKRLIAFALMPVDTSYFYSYNYMFDFQNMSYSAQLTDTSIEKTRKYLDDNTFQNKPIEECIEEGVYHHNLISFFGEFDFDEWNILRSCCFTDEEDISSIFQKQLNRLTGNIKDSFFKDPIFKETKSYHEENMNYPGSEYKIEISTEMKPYIGHSYLVAMIRVEKKAKVNHIYKNYIKNAIFEPFAIKLKTYCQDDYQQIQPFHSDHCDVLFPEHKRFCLLICIAIDKEEIPRIQYFVYRQQDDKIYEWVYFPHTRYEDYGMFSNAIVEVFEPISQFDNMDYILEPGCTLEDDNFWNNYVFKKEDNEYVYLKEIHFD